MLEKALSNKEFNLCKGLYIHSCGGAMNAVSRFLLGLDNLDGSCRVVLLGQVWGFSLNKG